MKLKAYLAAAWLVLLWAIPTAQASEQSRLFSPEDIFALEWANDVQVSPDGKSVVYVRHSNDIMTDSTGRSLWLV